MEIKLIKNEIIKKSKRSEKIKFVEISVSKIEEVDIELAEKFIKDIVNFNCRLDFTKETWKDVKEIIVDKYEKAQKYKMGYLKNDGTIIPLIANYILEKIMDIELLSYSEDLTDIEIVPKGFDSIFIDKNYNVFLCEYKSSISKLNEEGISNLFINGYKSLFCKDSSVISKINTIKNRIRKETKENKEKLINNLDLLIKNRRQLECINKDKIKFNVCSITKSKNKVDTNSVINKIDTKFDHNIFCLDERKNKCRRYDDCDKIDKIKVSNIIIIRIPDYFSIEEFYKNVIKILEEKVNE